MRGTSCLLLFLFGLADASRTVVNPLNSRAKYELKGVLGEGRWGIVYRVKDRNGNELAMKVDKEAVGKGWVHREVFALRAIGERGVVGRSPALVDNFVISESETTEKRHTVVSIAGESVMEEIRRNPLSEWTASSIGLQLIDAVQEITDRGGYIHNDLHIENVAFKSPGNRDEVILIDFGDSVPTFTPQSIAHYHWLYDSEYILDNFIRPSHPSTDANWFKAALESADDSHIDGLLEWWTRDTKAYIRNARIFKRLSMKKLTTLKLGDSIDDIIASIIGPRCGVRDRQWFEWLLTSADEDSHVLKFVKDCGAHLSENEKHLILSSRLIGRQLFAVQAERMDYTRCVLTLLQLFSVGNPFSNDHEWFRELLKGPRAHLDLFLRRGSVAELRPILESAWDVANSLEIPSYSLLRQWLNQILIRHAKVFEGRTIW